MICEPIYTMKSVKSWLIFITYNLDG